LQNLIDTAEMQDVALKLKKQLYSEMEKSDDPFGDFAYMLMGLDEKESSRKA
jgi:hypothetical protein